MPAEWETHQATWLAWPHNPADWPDKLDIVRWVYTEIVRRVSPGEAIRMLVNSNSEGKLARRYLSRAGVDAQGVEFIVHPTTAAGLETAARCLCGGTFPAGSKPRSCISISTRGPSIPTGARTAVCRRQQPSGSGKRLFHAQSKGRPFVLEGGGIEVNGRGTLLTTGECYGDAKTQVRNPGLAARNSRRLYGNTSA